LVGSELLHILQWSISGSVCRSPSLTLASQLPLRRKPVTKLRSQAAQRTLSDAAWQPKDALYLNLMRIFMLGCFCFGAISLLISPAWLLTIPVSAVFRELVRPRYDFRTEFFFLYVATQIAWIFAVRETMRLVFRRYFSSILAAFDNPAWHKIPGFVLVGYLGYLGLAVMSSLVSSYTSRNVP